MTTMAAMLRRVADGLSMAPGRNCVAVGHQQRGWLFMSQMLTLYTDARWFIFIWNRFSPLDCDTSQTPADKAVPAPAVNSRNEKVGQFLKKICRARVGDTGVPPVRFKRASWIINPREGRPCHYDRSRRGIEMHF